MIDPVQIRDGQIEPICLREASCRCWSGRLNLIVGPHGCGKTTLAARVIETDTVTAVTCTPGMTAWQQIRIAGKLLAGERKWMIDGYGQIAAVPRFVMLVFVWVTGRRLLAISHREHFGHRVAYRCPFDARIARKLVADLTRDQPPRVRQDVSSYLDTQLHRARPQNYRDLFCELYDVVAARSW